MLTKVILVAAAGTTLENFEMPVLVPGEDGFCITKVDGLNPVPINVNTKVYGGGEGEYFIGQTRGKRNIVLSFAIESRGYNVDTIRNLLYGHFYTQGNLRLRFEFDNRDPVEIDAYPETQEGDRFVQDVEDQISLICPKPNFVSPDVQSDSGVTAIDPAMTELVTLGDRSVGLAVKIIPAIGYENAIGNLVYETAVEGDTPGVYVTDHKLDIFPSDYDPALVAGEELWMDSRLGRKGVYIYNPTTGAVRNALKGMTNASRWPILHPGPNKFRVYTPDAAIAHAWEVFWYDEFGGI